MSEASIRLGMVDTCIWTGRLPDKPLCLNPFGSARQNIGGKSMGASATPLTERKYALPFVLVTSLFFLWGIGVNLNDVLIPHLKKAFGLSDFQSSFIQVAFFGGYFLGALPAGRLMEKIGYSGGILAGLLICATGALLFIPASII